MRTSTLQSKPPEGARIRPVRNRLTGDGVNQALSFVRGVSSRGIELD